SHTRCDALSAMEFEPDRKAVSHDGRHGGRGHPARISAGQPAGQSYGGHSLPRIQKKRRGKARLAQAPHNIRSTRSPAARTPDVNPLLPAHNKISKWNRSQEVGDKRGQLSSHEFGGINTNIRLAGSLARGTKLYDSIVEISAPCGIAHLAVT